MSATRSEATSKGVASEARERDVRHRQGAKRRAEGYFLEYNGR